MNKKILTVGWKVSKLDLNIASLRYRAMLPILALESEGVSCRVFSDGEFANIADLDVLVIVKSFSSDDYMLAQKAFLLGVPVILDLCDNIFIETYGSMSERARLSPASIFLQMAAIATLIVVTTEPLAEFVRKKLPRKDVVRVIPDGVETAPDIEDIRGRLVQAQKSQKLNLYQSVHRRLSKLAYKLELARSFTYVGLIKIVFEKVYKYVYWRTWAKKAYLIFDACRKRYRGGKAEPTKLVSVKPARKDKTILWFGNHGAPYANFGMLDLLNIQADLEKIATEYSVTLVIVSNNFQKYEKHIKPFKIDTEYVEWTPEAVSHELKKASVVVIPNSLDDFSICKSANRTVTALLADVPVVATLTPAVEVFRGCVEFDNFGDGLRKYLTNPELAHRNVSAAKDVITYEFGRSRIFEYWSEIVSNASSVGSAISYDAEVIFVINLIQDIDMVLPIILEAMALNKRVLVYCNTKLAATSPRVSSLLEMHHIPVLMMVEGMCQDEAFKFPASAKVLFSVVETNLGPHRFSRQLTEAANKAKLLTTTIQHGFENPGLTYDDEYHSIKKINFASQRIYLWGAEDTLHPKLSVKTKRKCVVMGCPKPAYVDKVNFDDVLPQGRKVVGVFENLHWLRYSDEYREFFISNVERLAERFPDVIFLIKPHHAGMWLTRRYKGAMKSLPNLIVADPSSSKWEAHTAPAIIAHCDAVITSPSTVALDAARQSVPVAVVAYQLDLSNYSPLPQIKHSTDWAQFVNDIAAEERRQSNITLANHFVRRVTRLGNVARDIVVDMCNISESDNKGVL